MSESGPTRGWFAVGIGLIILGAAIYGIMVLAGIGLAIGAASKETGAPAWLILLVPGLPVLGFLVLLTKVVVDRLHNGEDDHYSKTVDK